MKQRIWSGTCAAVTFALAAGLAAQTPQTPPQTSSQTTTSSKNITVTGCIQKAPEGATGTTGSTATRGMTEPKFLLTSASMGATGTSGTSTTSAGATATTSSAHEYRLDADDAKLTPHVGHKVEITGTLDQAASTSTTSTAAGQTASASVSSPKLKVDSVKMVAATCP